MEVDARSIQPAELILASRKRLPAWIAALVGAFQRRLHLQLALLLVMVLAASGAIEFMLLSGYSRRFALETDQRLNYHLAKSLAPVFERLISEEIDARALRSKIREITALNPRISIYILDRHGVIIGAGLDDFSRPARVAVDLEAIERFLRSGFSALPVLGDDPLDFAGQRAFSAARLKTRSPAAYLYVILDSEQVEQYAARGKLGYFTRILLSHMAIVSLAAMVVGAAAFFFMTRRFKQVISTIGRFEQGDLSARAGLTGQDEISEVGRAFDRLAASIVSYLGQLSQQTNQRRELFASLSHDLKGPLCSLTGYLETLCLKQQGLDEAKRQSFLETCQRTAQSLVSMVNELFERAKFDALDGGLNKTRIVLGELLTNVYERFQPQAQARQLNLEYFCMTPETTLEGDRGMLERALSNVVENGVKYTRRPGNVTVAGRRLGEWIELTVADNGMGIPTEDLPHIYERFYRVNKDQSKSADGTGLGLGITKRIIEAHAGWVHIESSVGIGTTVRLMLPANDSAQST